MARPAMPMLSAAVLLGQGRSGGDAATRRLRVLVAEADPSRRMRLAAVLAAAGEECLAMPSWAEAQGTLSRLALDAVVVSLDLPRAGGLGAGRTLRRWPAPVSDLPLLALHTVGPRLRETEWREAGFDELLRWPEDVADLAARLRAVVVRLTPPEPLDRAMRAALREELGPEAMAVRDIAALREAGGLVARLRDAADRTAAAAVIEALVLECEGIGAIAAAAAARAAAGQFPPATEALIGALAAAGSAIRFEGRARR